MKKLLLYFLLLTTSFVFSQQPYYSDVNLSLTGTALRDELATKIIATHTNFLSYTPGVWEACKVTDLDPDDGTSTNVLLIYGYNDSDGNYVTDRTRNKNLNGGAAGTEWNREHSYPKSLGNPNLGTSGPGSDAHHLRASDITMNGNRGSLLFADGSGNAGSSGGGWYPGDEWKGDVARMMMYMYLRYGSQCYPSNVAIGTANSVDSNMIDLLLEWNAEDPVSTYEDQRNTYHGNTSNTYAQGNRNPFIDNPNLATQIWGGAPAENRWVVDNEAPTAPANLIASNITNTALDLNWDASTDNVGVALYEIFQDGVSIGTSTNTTYNVTGLTQNTTYDFTVYAKDAAGNTSSVSNTENVTTTNVIDVTPPSAIVDLSSSNITDASATLSWSASTDDQGVTGYDVYQDGSLIGSTTNLVYNVTGLAASTSYTFTVFAKDGAGNTSGVSNSEVVTTLATPSYCGSESFANSNAPSGGYGDGSFVGDNSVTWTYVESRDDEGFEITGKGLMLRRSSDNSKVTSSTVVGGIGSFTCSLLKGFTGNGNRQVELFVNGVSQGSSIAWDNTSVQTFTVADINIAGDVVIEIRNVTSYQVVIDDISWTCYSITDNEAPSAVNDLSSSNVTSSSVDLSWTASTDNVGVTSYEIFQDGVSIGTTTLTSFSVTGLAAETSYDFNVYAKDGAGNTSAISNTETITTTAAPTSATDLFISEYVEGSSNNKAIEIANFTGASIADLSIYTLKRAANGSSTWGSPIALSGTLSNEMVHVVVNSNAGASLLAYADQTSSSDPMLFNGNDAIGLFKNNVLIDIIGVLGDASTFAENVTLRRKESVSSPNTTYTVSEWNSYPQDTFDGLGNHNLTLSTKDYIKNAFIVYPNPVLNGKIYLSTTNGFIIETIEIYNFLGTKVFEQKEIIEDSINIHALSSGIYILKVSNENNYSTRKIIVK